MAEPCSVPDCTRPVAGRGWCLPHYKRWQRTGDVQASRPIGPGRNPGKPKATHRTRVTPWRYV